MLLEVKDLQCEIANHSILKGVSINIKEGEMVGLIGPNGSGKTTLFNCLCGFAVTKAGSISLNGKEITNTPAFERSLAGLGRVFQNSGIFREMSVLENMIIAIESRQGVLETLWPWNRRNRENRAKAMEHLNMVGLADKALQKAGSLSGGQLRILEIIRTLAFGADLLLLDEPTAGVSPKMKDELIKLIKSLRVLGKTVVVIEHDINFIEQLCDRIAVMDLGEVVMDNTPDKVRGDPRLQEIYFGVKK